MDVWDCGVVVGIVGLWDCGKNIMTSMTVKYDC